MIRTDLPVRRLGQPQLTPAPASAVPPHRIERHDDALELWLHAPGLPADALEVTATTARLTITIIRLDPAEGRDTARNGTVLADTLPPAGQVRLSCPLPAGAERDQITSTLTDGIVHIHVPCPTPPVVTVPTTSG